jgi:hypothetical protein
MTTAIESEPHNGTLHIPLYIGESINLMALVAQRGSVLLIEPFSSKMTHYAPSTDKSKPGDYEALEAYYDKDVIQQKTVILLPDIRTTNSPHVGRVGFTIVSGETGLEMNIPFVNPLYEQIRDKSDDERKDFFRKLNILPDIYMKSIGPDMVVVDNQTRYPCTEGNMIVVPLKSVQKTHIYLSFGTIRQRRVWTFSMQSKNDNWVLKSEEGIEEDIQLGDDKYIIFAPEAMAAHHGKWVEGMRKHESSDAVLHKTTSEKRMPRPVEAQQFFVR